MTAARIERNLAMSVLTTGAVSRGSLRYQLDTRLGRLTPFERAERGKTARAAVPREAESSVLSRFTGASRYANQGQRVVAGQRLMQAASDIFLGWQHIEAGPDGQQRDFYVRQLRDWKFSLPIEIMVPRGMRLYGQLCG